MIRGDTGEIIGRSKGFVYNGREKDEVIVPAGERPSAQVAQRIIGRAGMAHTRFDTTSRTFRSNVDNMHRWVLVMAANADSTGSQVMSAHGPRGQRGALLRDRALGSTVIILTESDSFDAWRVATAITDRVR